MRIVFIGSSQSSKLLLKQSLRLKLNIVGICTLKKSFNNDFVDLKKEFSKFNIPKIYSSNINSNYSYKWIKNKKPDLIFCFGWSQILKKKIFSLSKIATIGFHPTELPKNRGRHPIIWSLALGLSKTASTFFKIDNEFPDSGRIISQKIIKIEKNDVAGSLYNKIMKCSIKQLPKIIKNLKKKNFFLMKNKKIYNSWRKRKYIDGMIDWRMSAKDIYNLTRALDKPYMNSHFYLGRKEIKVLKCKIVNYKNDKYNFNLEPGKILNKKINFFDVKCGEGVVRILKTNKKLQLKNINYL